jgi:hypothetical protein
MFETGVLPEGYVDTTGLTAEHFTPSAGTAAYLASRSDAAAAADILASYDSGLTSMPCTDEDPELFFP